MIKLKRAYGPTSRNDGERLLVERLWPRGLRKDDAHFDGWLKEIAPSDELRKWFGHDPARFREFRDRYKRELHNANARQLLDELAHRAAHGTVTLVYSAHDEQHNNAIVLAEEIERRIRRGRPTAGQRAKRARGHPASNARIPRLGRLARRHRLSSRPRP